MANHLHRTYQTLASSPSSVSKQGSLKRKDDHDESIHELPHLPLSGRGNGTRTSPALWPRDYSGWSVRWRDSHGLLVKPRLGKTKTNEYGLFSRESGVYDKPVTFLVFWSLFLVNRTVWGSLSSFDSTEVYIVNAGDTDVGMRDGDTPAASPRSAWAFLSGNWGTWLYSASGVQDATIEWLCW